MEIRFRNATLLDLELLLEWRNDALTRKFSKNSKIITKVEHEQWLNATLKNKDKKLYIAVLAGEPVGTVRLDRIDSEWELSWSLAPSSRGKGLGKEMVKKATDLVSDSLIAYIKEENLASIYIAEYSGFSLTSKLNDMLEYRLIKVTAEKNSGSR